MSRWIEIPIRAPILRNVIETSLRNQSAALENAYINDADGLSRFPHLNKIVTLPGNNRVYLDEWRDDLIAVSGGRTYKVDKSNNFKDVTGASVSGTGRATFAQTDTEIVMAAGSKLVTLRGEKTENLAEEAPESTHVAYVDGYLVAIEPRSGRFFHCKNGVFTEWNPLDVFSAEGKPDNLNAAIVTEFGELLLAGPRSIEQFESSASGTRPFVKRWQLGDGLSLPYTMVSVGNAIWGMNQRNEFVSFSAQVSKVESEALQYELEQLDDRSEGWAVEVTVQGQRFILLQFPNATNPYETKGVTLLFDYKRGRWQALFGWDEALSAPSRWPGWSYKKVNGRDYVGGEGCIYELKGFSAPDGKQRTLWRSGHIDRLGSAPVRIEEIAMRVRRGDTEVNSKPSIISMRVNRDNRGFGRWVRRDLGRAGQKEMTIRWPACGAADTFQFELDMTDAGGLEITKIDARITDLR